jgi:hypothetical protein
MTTVNETPADETAVLAAEPDLLHLPEADIDIYVEKLKTRQLFKFLKILTKGAGPLLGDLSLGQDTNAEELGQDILALLLVSLGNADNEIIEFLQSMVRPTGLIDPERTKLDREENVAKYTALYTLLDNPEIADLVALLTFIVKAEAPNLVSLGKQVAAMLPTAAKQTTSSKKRSPKSTPATS